MIKRIFAAVISFILLFSATDAVFAEEMPEKQYIVKYKAASMSLMNTDSNECPFDVVDETSLNELLENDLVEWCEEDYSVELFDGTDDTDSQTEDEKSEETPEKKYDESKWDLEMVRADFTYDINCEGQDIKIGVIDSGIAENEDLNDNVLAGYNYASESADTNDTYGHGTFVSGIIASLDDSKGIIGVSPKAKLVPLKCFEVKNANVSVICKAIYGAVNNFGCDIINMSFGLEEDSRALKEAIDYAAEKGVIVVAAVGNAGTSALNYPASYENVIGVGAVDKNGEHSSFSQHNKSVFVTAPGSSVKSTYFKGGYITGSGTSYAAPFVTAAAASMLSMDDELSFEQIKNILSASADDKGSEGYDEYYGYGILNLENCAKSVMQGTPYFISPVETSGTESCAVVYNNTQEQFSGQFILGEYNGRIMKSLTPVEVEIPAGKTASVKNSLSGYSAKCFVWKSMEDNTPVSNTRSISADEKTEEITDEQLLINVDLKDESDKKSFSLILNGLDNTLVYAVQDKLPEGGVYEISVPRERIAESTETGAMCSIYAGAKINGKETSVHIQAHNYEDKVIDPTKTEKGYTEHTCKECGDTYRDNETEAIGYFVTYDSNGGETAPERQNKRPEEPLVLTSDLPLRTGYTFLGWSTDKSAEQPEYEPGAQYLADEDITLYALWRVNTYKLIYMLNGETYKTVEINYGDKISAEKEPSKSGYTFSGWKDLPAVMPANDVTVSGKLSKKSTGGGGGGGGGGGSYKAPTVVTPVKPTENTEQTAEKNIEDNTQNAEEDYVAELFSFSDVNKDAWYYDSVRFMTEKGLMKGMSETEFSPNTELTRAMFVTILYRMDNEPKTEYDLAFSDVSDKEYYSNAVSWAASNGIVSGITQEMFAPNEKINREQMAVMAYRYAEYKGYRAQTASESAYTDQADISDFAQNAVNWTAEENILNGTPDGGFYPKKPAFRAEAATLFMRLYEKMN